MWMISSRVGDTHCIVHKPFASSPMTVDAGGVTPSAAVKTGTGLSSANLSTSSSAPALSPPAPPQALVPDATSQQMGRSVAATTTRGSDAPAGTKERAEAGDPPMELATQTPS